MSSIKLRKLQIGLSNDASKNVTLFQSDTEDGVLRFGTGDESSLTEAFSIDNSGNLSLSSANLSSSDVSDFDSAAKNAVDKTHVDGLGVDASTVGGLSTTELWNVNNDGAGSGLDADTIDGIESTEFALLSGAVFSGDVTVSGDFTVSGTTTTVDTTNTSVQDAVLTLNSGQASPLNDVGLLFQRYASADATNYNVGLAWDESADKFVLGKTSEDGSDNDLLFGEEWLTVDSNGDAVFVNDVTVGNDLTVAGNILTANRPGFRATYDTGDNSGWSSGDKLLFPSVIVDNANNYDSSLSRFTAPISGFYQCEVSLLWDKTNSSTRMDMLFYVNGSEEERNEWQSPVGFGDGRNRSFELNRTMYLNAGDYLEAFATCGNDANWQPYTTGSLWGRFTAVYIG